MVPAPPSACLGACASHGSQRVERRQPHIAHSGWVICFSQQIELALAPSPCLSAVRTKHVDASSFMNQLPLHAVASFEHEALAEVEGVNRLTVFNCTVSHPARTSPSPSSAQFCMLAALVPEPCVVFCIPMTRRPTQGEVNISFAGIAKRNSTFCSFSFDFNWQHYSSHPVL